MKHRPDAIGTALAAAIATVAFLAALAGLALLPGPSDIELDSGSTTTIPVTLLELERIEEDDPRWDCRTMGNRICNHRPTADQPTTTQN